TYLRMNNNALKARRDGAEHIRQADEALRNGKTPDARRLLKAIQTNQYLSPADKKLAQQLEIRINMVKSTNPLPHREGVEIRVLEDERAKQARVKLREARALLAKGDYQGAGDQAIAAQRLGGVYAANEDSPRKVLADVDRAARAAAAR